MILERGKFSISSACSRLCLASGNVSTKSDIMPTRCVPWPGKKMAVFGWGEAFD